jgi:hypothetical protein
VVLSEKETGVVVTGEALLLGNVIAFAKLRIR